MISLKIKTMIIKSLSLQPSMLLLSLLSIFLLFNKMESLYLLHQIVLLIFTVIQYSIGMYLIHQSIVIVKRENILMTLKMVLFLNSQRWRTRKLRRRRENSMRNEV